MSTADYPHPCASTAFGTSFMTDDASFWIALDAPGSMNGGSRFSSASEDSASTVRVSDLGRDGASGRQATEATENGELEAQMRRESDTWSTVGANEEDSTREEAVLSSVVADLRSPADSKDSRDQADSDTGSIESVESRGARQSGDIQGEQASQVTLHAERAERERIKHLHLPSPTTATYPAYHASYDSSQSKSDHPSHSCHTSSPTSTTLDETPFPSRILHLFPRLSTLTHPPSSPAKSNANSRVQLQGLQGRLPTSMSMSIGLAQLREQLNEAMGSVGTGAGAHEHVAAGQVEGDEGGEGSLGQVGECAGVLPVVGVSQVVQAVRGAVIDVVKGLVGPSMKGIWMWPGQLREVVHDIKTSILPLIPLITSPLTSSHFLAFTSSDTRPSALSTHALSTHALSTLFTFPYSILSMSTPTFASILLSGETPPQISDTIRAPREHLYAQETIYTLRMPPSKSAAAQAKSVGDGRGETAQAVDEMKGVDIGPTVRPVWVKKRSAMPDFQGATGRVEMGWGREVEWRMRL